MEAISLGKCEYGAEEDESSTGRGWAAEIHHVTASFRLAGILKLMNFLI
jgi:hypothetical protein